MKLRRNLYALALVVCSVSATYFVTVSTAGQQAKSSNNDYQIGGTLYMQKAAEYRAVAYQAFNQARWQLDARFAEVDKARDLFGKRYIVLPNAMYGTWENAI